MKRITDDNGYIKHNDEIQFFNQLIIDLKKQLLFIQPDQPITMHRLQEATQHIGKLMDCKEVARFR